MCERPRRRVLTGFIGFLWTGVVIFIWLFILHMIVLLFPNSLIASAIAAVAK